VEEEAASGAEGGALGLYVEGDEGAPDVLREAQGSEIEGPGASGEEGFERDGVESGLGGGEEGVGVGVGACPGDEASVATLTGLVGLARSEVDPERDPAGEDEAAAGGVEAQRCHLEGECFPLAEEALAGEAGEVSGDDTAGEGGRWGLAATWADDAVWGDESLGVSDGGGEEAWEGSDLASLERADAGLSPDDGVEEGALEGECGGEGVGERVEPRDEGADAA
jgi:hypothetical protein